MYYFKENEKINQIKDQQCQWIDQETQNLKRLSFSSKNRNLSIKQASKGLFRNDKQVKQEIFECNIFIKLNQKTIFQGKTDFFSINYDCVHFFFQDSICRIGPMTIKFEMISDFYKPIKIIPRFQCKQLFLLEQISLEKKKFLMKVNEIKSIINKQLIEGQVEIENLLQLDHPNIIKIKECFLNFNKYMIVLQYFEGIPLIDYLKQHKINQQTGKSIICQLLQSLACMHQKNIIHRDIRAEHIFVSGYEQDPSKIKLKIVDMRLSITHQKLKKCNKNSVGSEYYASPESQEGIITQKYDIWSVGILALIIFCHFQPNFMQNQDYLQAIMQKNQLYKTHITNVPLNVLQFIDSLLVINHLKRPTAREALDYPWLSLNSYHPKSLIKKNASKELFYPDKFFHQ